MKKTVKTNEMLRQSSYRIKTHVFVPHPEPLCWLLSLEGDGRYEYAPYSKQSEGECIRPIN